jgi:uncharacterized protein (DUF1330 family)
MAIDPNEDQAIQLGKTPQNEPVIFLNLHRYHDRAQYGDDYDDSELPADVSGYEAYHRYLWPVERDFMPQVGGRFLMVGPVEVVLIGEGEWDEVVIGQYPSKTEAFRMPTLDGYSDINVHRVAGLQDVQTLAFSKSQFERFAIIDAE